MNKVKKIAIGVTATGILLASAFPAFAAKPNNQACLGEDISGYAQVLQPLGQNLLPNITSGGAGNEVQAHLAGDVPDEVIPNSCND